jgi:PAS domain S-box-containing protein
MALDATSASIFASLPDPVAVVDREGRIITVNSKWIESAAAGVLNTSDVPGPSAGYLDALRRAANDGVPQAAALVEGIAAVSTGRLDRYQTSYRCAAADAEREVVITVTPLQHPRGGAVIAYTDVRHHAVSRVADGIGQATFQRLADQVPIPLIMVDPQGQVLHANQQWWDAAGDRAGSARGSAGWTDALDLDVAAHATAALRSAVDTRADVDLELRLKGVDGRYRWWALTLAPRFAHDGAVDGCVGVCHDVTTRRHMQATLGELARKLIAAQETERARIARELHDDLGQQVALLATQVDTLSPTSAREPELETVRGSLHALAHSLTSLSRQLHPGKIRLLGVARTLEGLCGEMGRETGLHIEFSTRGVPRDLDEECGVSLFRVAQEALRNAVKHSHATTIVVRLEASGSSLTLRVSDNGNGFDPLTSQASGIGLLTMRERVELMSGTLTVESARPHGTAIRVVVPVVKHPPVMARPRRPAVAAPRPVPVAARLTRPAFSVPAPRSSA